MAPSSKKVDSFNQASTKSTSRGRPSPIKVRVRVRVRVGEMTQSSRATYTAICTQPTYRPTRRHRVRVRVRVRKCVDRVSG